MRNPVGFLKIRKPVSHIVHKKVTEHKKAWQKEKEIVLYKQIFLIATV